MDLYFVAACLQQVVDRCIIVWAGPHTFTGTLRQVVGIDAIDLEPSSSQFENTRIWLKDIVAFSVYKETETE